MNTKELSKEQISAFADGELSEAQADVVLAALRTEQGLAAWNAYHLIGDAVRSDEMAVEMSPEFFSKFSARLDAEPTVIAPVAAPEPADRQDKRMVANGGSIGIGGLTVRRFAIPALALSLAAAIVFILQPHPATVVATGVATPDVASTAAPAQQAATTAAVAPAGPAAGSPAVASLAREGEVVRDPKIDKFLDTHQHYSTQQSTEQYGRSAAFNVETDK
jgi:sigma-E factor negative regulatory protein RseA